MNLKLTICITKIEKETTRYLHFKKIKILMNLKLTMYITKKSVKKQVGTYILRKLKIKPYTIKRRDDFLNLQKYH